MYSQNTEVIIPINAFTILRKFIMSFEDYYYYYYYYYYDYDYRLLLEY